MTKKLGCSACSVASGEILPYGIAPLHCDSFVIYPKPEPGIVPGWLLIAPTQHIEQIDALSPEQAIRLGSLVHTAARVLREQTGCEKIYVNIFAEVMPHMHVHVIARPADLPANFRGPAIFSAGEGDVNQTHDVAHKILTALRATIK